MKNRYNLALVPMTISDEVVRHSHAFIEYVDKYILGEKSLPHVTLFQFAVGEDEIESIWTKVCEKWRDEPTELMFENFSCLTFDNQVYWLSLLPNNTDALQNMHRIIADIINQPVKKSFDPHMTLINTKNKEYKVKVDEYSHKYKPISDMFLLKLGKCDDVGQFTEVIYTYETRLELSCRK